MQTDPSVQNAAYPDQYATYWSGSLNIPAGGEVRLDGVYPHARYMSFNLYNPQLQPIDALADVEIAPAANSAQPFASGADRLAEPRRYSVHLISATRPTDPAQRAPNTLYSFTGANGQAVPSQQAVIIYRIYVTDKGRNVSGDVGLPTIVLKQANGQEVSGTDACTALKNVTTVDVASQINVLKPPADPAFTTDAFQHPQWLKFFDLPSAEASRFNASPLAPVGAVVSGRATQSSGGFLSNVHNSYVFADIAQKYGAVAAFAGKAPRTPATYDGESTMGSGDMRYFSFCTNEANSTRFIACVYDEQVVRDAAGRYVLAVTRAADRPANARAECGVTWLEWGPFAESLLIYRHMLVNAQSAFPQAIQYIQGPPGANEVATMGDYYPYGNHYSKAAFEALGCPVSPDAIPRLSAQ